MRYETKWTKPSEVKREWYVVDIKGEVLGRTATQIASLLIGKAKPEIRPSVDCGDYVVVINSDLVELTRGKEKKKFYRTHTGYPGGLKEIRFDDQLKKDSRQIITGAVKNMLPKNNTRDVRMARLFVYKDANHKNSGQKPKEYKLS